MVNLLALLPVLVLLLGALALLPARNYPRVRPWVSLVAVLLSLALLLVCARQPDTNPFLLNGAYAQPDLNLRFDYGPIPVLFASIVLTAYLARLLIENLRVASRAGAAALLTLAGAVGFFCADNLTTLAAAWVLADFGLLVWRLASLGDQTGRPEVWRAWGVSTLGAVLLLAAGVLLLNEGSSLVLREWAPGGPAATLILLAAWIRTGIYPFHYLPPAADEKGSKDGLRILACTFLFGAYLLVRALSGLQDEPARVELLQLLAVVSIAATGLLALFERETARAIHWSAWATGAMLFLVLPVGGQVRADLTLWSALALFASVTMADAARALRAQSSRFPWKQVLWLGSILSIAGSPLTVGLLGRVGLLAALAEGGEYALLLLVAAIAFLAPVPLFVEFLQAGKIQERRPTYLEYAAIVLLLGGVVGGGVFPFVFSAWLGPAAQEASALASDALFHAPSPLFPLLLLTLVLLPIPLVFLFALRLGEQRQRFQDPAGPLVPLLDLTWLARGMDRLSDSTGALVHRASALIEQYPIGWVLFAAIWLAIWLLSSR